MRKARRAAARRGRRLRIMFTDEARFGRMNRIRPCWAPIGTRPAVPARLEARCRQANAKKMFGQC